MSSIYPKRVVFFIDILGFKSIVESKNDNAYKYKPNDILRIFKKISDFDIYKDDDKKIRAKIVRTVQTTQFSDSLVISFEITDPSQLFHSLGQIQWVIYFLAIEEGILLRGAASVGDLYHNEGNIFGPAMNKAYELESKISVNPRIIIDESILDICSQYSEQPFQIPNISIEQNRKFTCDREKTDMMVYLKKDNDGYFYIDYFTKNAHGAAGGEYYEYPEYMGRLKNIITNGLKEKSISVVSKYMWMKEQYNNAIDELSPDIIKDLVLSKIT